jgi:hypothetical protein
VEIFIFLISFLFLSITFIHFFSTPGTGAVQTPTLKFAPISTGRTFWFTSPIVIDLDRDPTCTSNCNEISM